MLLSSRSWYRSRIILWLRHRLLCFCWSGFFKRLRLQRSKPAAPAPAPQPGLINIIKKSPRTRNNPWGFSGEPLLFFCEGDLMNIHIV